MDLFGIYGASGFGREVMPMVGRGRGEPFREVFIDDSPQEGVDSINGRALLTWDAFLGYPAMRRFVSLAIANSVVRERLDARCREASVPFFEIRAADCVVMDDVDIGEGAILGSFVTLTSNIKIGRHFHANLYSYVAHDCMIGDFVTFAPAVRCNGNVSIEDHAYIGTGAILKQGRPEAPLTIGRGAVVGMGAVVTRNVAPGETVVGNPARPLVRSPST